MDKDVESFGALVDQTSDSEVERSEVENWIYLLLLRDQLLVTRGSGGWRILEDDMISRGKGGGTVGIDC